MTQITIGDYGLAKKELGEFVRNTVTAPAGDIFQHLNSVGANIDTLTQGVNTCSHLKTLDVKILAEDCLASLNSVNDDVLSQNQLDALDSVREKCLSFRNTLHV